MGGHGALTLYLGALARGSRQYRSASAFAPIANPSKCKWGEKAFGGYLAGGVAEGAEKFDATEAVQRLGGKEPLHILVDYVRRPRAGLCGRNRC
jgi:S-formylglutathione hydrolase